MGEKILIIDDEEAILELLKFNLEIYGYKIFTSNTGKGILEKIIEIHPNIILLDLMLPEIDGMSICKKVRENSIWNDLRIIILSAKSQEIDKITCLEIGADDYITKPFSIRELIARIHAFSRRISPSVPTTQEIIQYHDLIIDPKEKTVLKKDKKISLTLLELKLLLYLLKNQGKISTREMIFKNVWNYEEQNNTRSLDVNIRKLRQKLEDSNNHYIETIRGIGYKLL